jgi:predicted dehydrogenase
VIGSGPRAGEDFPVEVATTVLALIEFASGAIVTLGASWDVFAHGHHNIELYGTEGALFVPDPNFFAGEVEFAGRDGTRRKLDMWEHPLAIPNQRRPDGQALANYRAAGLADMVRALEAGRPARCSFELALHALDVMTGILKSAESGQFVEMTTSCAQPPPLGPDEAGELLNADAARAAAKAASAGGSSSGTA